MAAKRKSILLAAVLLAGCASTGSVPEPARTADASTGNLPLEIHWVRNSAEYRAALEQTYRLAGEAIGRRVAGREPGTWAVAVDVDETLISNSLQSRERALGPPVPFEEVWEDWVERRAAPALPGAKAFLERVIDLGGRVAAVTNRRENLCQATAENLRNQEMPFDVLLCRTDTRDKRPRWRMVAEGTAKTDLPPLEILMWVGDNIQDFPGLDQDLRFGVSEDFSRFGDVFFILPNPLYGSWEDNPQD